MADKVLVVDDDATICAMLTSILRREGHEVHVALGGEQALAMEQREKPDLILLDLILPDMDGVDVCRRMRHQTSAPIIILSARADVVDKVVGLEVGADDYVTKPFGAQELMARVKAVLRRAKRQVGPVSDDEVLDFGDVRIDRARHEVVVRGESRTLTRKEFDLLRTLAANAGRVMTTQALLREVWDCDVAIESRTVDVHIGRVRSKIEEDRKSPQLIITVPRVGYKFVPPNSVAVQPRRERSASGTSQVATSTL